MAQQVELHTVVSLSILQARIPDVGALVILHAWSGAEQALVAAPSRQCQDVRVHLPERPIGLQGQGVNADSTTLKVRFVQRDTEGRPAARARRFPRASYPVDQCALARHDLLVRSGGPFASLSHELLALHGRGEGMLVKM